MVDLQFHAGKINSRQALERLKVLSDIPCWAEVSLTAISRRPTDAFMALLGADLQAVFTRLLNKLEKMRELAGVMMAHGTR